MMVRLSVPETGPEPPPPKAKTPPSVPRVDKDAPADVPASSYLTASG
jgi:hypothetical protein